MKESVNIFSVWKPEETEKKLFETGLQENRLAWPMSRFRFSHLPQMFPKLYEKKT